MDCDAFWNDQEVVNDLGRGGNGLFYVGRDDDEGKGRFDQVG